MVKVYAGGGSCLFDRSMTTSELKKKSRLKKKGVEVTSLDQLAVRPMLKKRVGKWQAIYGRSLTQTEMHRLKHLSEHFGIHHPTLDQLTNVGIEKLIKELSNGGSHSSAV